MARVLVAYFSASGTTAKLAKNLAEVLGADLHEIKPMVPYTTADLNWMDKKARSTVEMHDKDFRPAIGNQSPDMKKYDTLYIGFPIWLAYHNLIQCTQA